MENDDLLDATNDELKNSENVENENEENEVINSNEESDKSELEEKNDVTDPNEESVETDTEEINEVIESNEESNQSEIEEKNVVVNAGLESIQSETEEVEETSNVEEKTEGVVKTESEFNDNSEKGTQKENVVDDDIEYLNSNSEDTFEADEEEEEDSKIIFEDIDYSTLSQEDLVNQLKLLLEKTDINETKDRIESIKTNFYKKHHGEIDEKKQAFIEAGGTEEEFSPASNPIEEEFKAYYTIFKEKRAEFNVNLEKEKETNLALKYQIIDKIGELITGQESLNKTFHDFKELQKKWQEIGLVPQSEVKTLWDSYNYQIEKFYDYVKINKDLRDLDLKKNLELKIELCERAEELLVEPKIVTAFKDLQKLHEQWREIGPVPSDKKDELWERFKQATSKINKKHQDYFESLKKEQLNNLKAKNLLCDKVEEIMQMNLSTPKEWEENSKEIIELQRMWKLIGFAPKKENNKIYDRFRKACDAFFDAKREYYSKNKEEEENNLHIKTEFCLQAESMQDSTDWHKTTDFYIELQKKWKTIGPVPRKHKDEIWNRFRKACNTFFDRKSGHFSSKDSEQDNNLELKRALIEKLKVFELSEDNQSNFKQLNQIQKEWTSIGHVPIKFKDEITQEFRELLNGIFDKLDLSEADKMKLQFRNKLEALKNSPKSYNRLRNERDKLVTKMEKLKTNIVLWENNIGFFAKSKSADAMIKDFQNKIARAKQSVIALEEELIMLDELL